MPPRKESYPLEPSVVDLLTRGEAALEARKSAPMVAVAGQKGIQIKKDLDRFAKENGEVDAQGRPMPETIMHRFPGDRHRTEEYVDAGYKPVVMRGKWEKHMGDPYWEIPMDIYRAELEAKVERSDKILKRSAITDAKKADGQRLPGSGETVSTGTEVEILDATEKTVDAIVNKAFRD